MKRLMLISASLLIVLAGVAAAWLYRDAKTPYYGAPSPQVFVEVPRGARPDSIAGLLVNAGVLRSRTSFLAYLRWTGASRRLQAGEYRFAAPATPLEVAQKLIRGDVYYVAITIPEGLTAREEVELLSAAGLGAADQLEQAVSRTGWIRDLDPTAQNLEGYLFPETYRFRRKAGSEEIIKAMVDQFRSRFAQLTAKAPVPAGWTNSRIVILASLIEKEAKSETERPVVASVLINRLERRMPLACDPTIIYALKLASKYDGNLRKADLGLDSPYNSYTHPGLPPTPIANPGESSLRAALAPAHTDYLFYVSKNDGTHQFSRDYRSHQIAVQQYQRSGGRR